MMSASDDADSEIWGLGDGGFPALPGLRVGLSPIPSVFDASSDTAAFAKWAPRSIGATASTQPHADDPGGRDANMVHAIGSSALAEDDQRGLKRVVEDGGSRSDGTSNGPVAKAVRTVGTELHSPAVGTGRIGYAEETNAVKQIEAPVAIDAEWDQIKGAVVQEIARRGLVRGDTAYHHGVNWEQRGQKWVAVLKRGGKKAYLGRFDTSDEAKACRDAHMLQLGHDPGTTTSSVFRGVSWANHAGRWHAHLSVDCKRKYLGSFDDSARGEVDAALAYDVAARAAGREDVANFKAINTLSTSTKEVTPGRAPGHCMYLRANDQRNIFEGGETVEDKVAASGLTVNLDECFVCGVFEGRPSIGGAEADAVTAPSAAATVQVPRQQAKYVPLDQVILIEACGQEHELVGTLSVPQSSETIVYNNRKLAVAAGKAALLSKPVSDGEALMSKMAFWAKNAERNSDELDRKNRVKMEACARKKIETKARQAGEITLAALVHAALNVIAGQPPSALGAPDREVLLASPGFRAALLKLSHAIGQQFSFNDVTDHTERYGRYKVAMGASLHDTELIVAEFERCQHINFMRRMEMGHAEVNAVLTVGDSVGQQFRAAFKNIFGAQWDAVCKKGAVYSAAAACARLEVNAIQLKALVYVAKAARSWIECDAGFIIARVESGKRKIYVLEDLFEWMQRVREAAPAPTCLNVRVMLRMLQECEDMKAYANVRARKNGLNYQFECMSRKMGRTKIQDACNDMLYSMGTGVWTYDSMHVFKPCMLAGLQDVNDLLSGDLSMTPRHAYCWLFDQKTLTDMRAAQAEIFEQATRETHSEMFAPPATGNLSATGTAPRQRGRPATSDVNVPEAEENPTGGVRHGVAAMARPAVGGAGRVQGGTNDASVGAGGTRTAQGTQIFHEVFVPLTTVGNDYTLEAHRPPALALDWRAVIDLHERMKRNSDLLSECNALSDVNMVLEKAMQYFAPIMERRRVHDSNALGRKVHIDWMPPDGEGADGAFDTGVRKAICDGYVTYALKQSDLAAENNAKQRFNLVNAGSADGASDGPCIHELDSIEYSLEQTIANEILVFLTKRRQLGHLLLLGMPGTGKSTGTRKMLRDLVFKCAWLSHKSCTRLCPNGAAGVAMSDAHGTAHTVFFELQSKVNDVFMECHVDIGSKGVRDGKFDGDAHRVRRRKAVQDSCDKCIDWLDEGMTLAPHLYEVLVAFRRQAHDESTSAFLGAMMTLIIGMDLLQLPAPGQSKPRNPSDRSAGVQEDLDWDWSSRCKSIFETSLFQRLCAEGAIIMHYGEAHRWPDTADGNLATEAIGLLREGIYHDGHWTRILEMCLKEGAVVNMSDSADAGVRLVGGGQDEFFYNRQPMETHMSTQPCCTGLLDFVRTCAEQQEFFYCRCGAGSCASGSDGGCTVVFRGSVEVHRGSGCYGCGSTRCGFSTCKHKGERRGEKPLFVFPGAVPMNVEGGSTETFRRAESTKVIPAFGKPIVMSPESACCAVDGGEHCPRCPTHDVPLEKFKAKSNGEEYYRCPQRIKRRQSATADEDKGCEDEAMGGGSFGRVAQSKFNTKSLTAVQMRELSATRDILWQECGYGKAWTSFVLTRGHFGRCTENSGPLKVAHNDGGDDGDSQPGAGLRATDRNADASAFTTTGLMGKFIGVVDGKVLLDVGKDVPLEMSVCHRSFMVYWVSAALDDKYKPRDASGKRRTECWSTCIPGGKMPPETEAQRLRIDVRWMKLVPGERFCCIACVHIWFVCGLTVGCGFCQDKALQTRKLKGSSLGPLSR
jgi:hypothetical protein